MWKWPFYIWVWNHLICGVAIRTVVPVDRLRTAVPGDKKGAEDPGSGH